MKVFSLPLHHPDVIPESSTWEVALIGDAHRGVIHSHTKSWKNALAWVKGGKNRRALLMGDLLDGIPSNDKRYDSDVLDPNMPDVFKQTNAVAEEVAPIADRVIGLLHSNHSFVPGVRAVGNIDLDFVQRVKDKSGVTIPWLTYESIIILDEEMQHKWFVSHGFGSINSNHLDEGTRRATMERHLRMKLIRKPGMGRTPETVYDLKAMGHTHKLLVRRPQLIQGPEIHPVQREDKSWKLKGEYAYDDPTFYVNTGSFLKLWIDGVSGYANMAGYDPVDLGFAVVKLRDNAVQDVEVKLLG